MIEVVVRLAGHQLQRFSSRHLKGVSGTEKPVKVVGLVRIDRGEVMRMEMSLLRAINPA